MSILTRIAEFHAQTHSVTVVQVEPGEDFDWWPKAGQVAILTAYYEPGMLATPSDGRWTRAAKPDRVVRKGRVVEACLWWHQLQHDYDGWRYGSMPPSPAVDQFELPAVWFDRAGEVEVEFAVLDGVEVSTLTRFER